MSDKLCIHGGRVIDPANGVDTVTDVSIANGAIVAVGSAPDGFVPDRKLDASGLIVCPGLIDLSVRLREPGFEHKATIKSETTAAAASGITTVCMPPDTRPIVETPADVELISQRAERRGMARVAVLGAMTQGLKGEQLSEVYALKQAGCVGLSNAGRPIPNTLVMRRVMEYAATHDMTVFLHAQDPWLANHGCVHEGPISARMGLTGVPEAAESVAVARELELIEHTGVRAHFCRLSSNRALAMIRKARADGLPVSADVAAHQLHLTEVDIADFNALAHVQPPLRTQRDRDALRAGLFDGAVAAICSDHQPHEDDAKLAPFPATEPGISGLETLLPLALRLADEGIPLDKIIASLTINPANILGLKAGQLRPGRKADICIFDPEQWWPVRPNEMVSRGHNTPFAGWEMKGKVRYTLLGGREVYRAG